MHPSPDSRLAKLVLGVLGPLLPLARRRVFLARGGIDVCCALDALGALGACLPPLIGAAIRGRRVTPRRTLALALARRGLALGLVVGGVGLGGVDLGLGRLRLGRRLEAIEALLKGRHPLGKLVHAVCRLLKQAPLFLLGVLVSHELLKRLDVLEKVGDLRRVDVWLRLGPLRERLLRFGDPLVDRLEGRWPRLHLVQPLEDGVTGLLELSQLVDEGSGWLVGTVHVQPVLGVGERLDEHLALLFRADVEHAAVLVAHFGARLDSVRLELVLGRRGGKLLQVSIVELPHGFLRRLHRRRVQPGVLHWADLDPELGLEGLVLGFELVLRGRRLLLGGLLALLRGLVALLGTLVGLGLLGTLGGALVLQQLAGRRRLCGGVLGGVRSLLSRLGGFVSFGLGALLLGRLGALLGLGFLLLRRLLLLGLGRLDGHIDHLHHLDDGLGLVEAHEAVAIDTEVHLDLGDVCRLVLRRRQAVASQGVLLLDVGHAADVEAQGFGLGDARRQLNVLRRGFAVLDGGDGVLAGERQADHALVGKHLERGQERAVLLALHADRHGVRGNVVQAERTHAEGGREVGGVQRRAEDHGLS
mmetsp:Transcript_3831/g.15469  ORF Transcript_3831/g.15469 Transcript_3831/m.15469 type:complete len:587 (-) Transcript_3831:1216-2976(-)